MKKLILILLLLTACTNTYNDKGKIKAYNALYYVEHNAIGNVIKSEYYNNITNEIKTCTYLYVSLYKSELDYTAYEFSFDIGSYPTYHVYVNNKTKTVFSVRLVE